MTKKQTIIAILLIVLIGGMNQLLLGSTFQFPSKIKYKLVKQNKALGQCILSYSAQAKNMANVSALRLYNFQAMGYSTKEKFITYFFSTTTNIYSIFTMEGQREKSQIRMVESATTFDLEQGKVFKYKEGDNSQLQTEIFAKYKVIDLLSSFFIGSKRVAEGSHAQPQKYNFFFDKSTKIVDMVHLGSEQAPFDGKMVDTELLVMTISNVEIFRLNIYKDPTGYCFPVIVSIKDYRNDSNDTFELRADEIIRNDREN